MNIRTLLATAAFAFAALSSTAQATPSNVQAKPYHYGMPLDVAKVIALEEPQPANCEVVNVKFTYLNSVGVVEAITYVKMAKACEEQN